MTTYSLKHPLEDDARVALDQVSSTVTALGIHACLIGAQARVIWIEHICGLPSSRATQDPDIAIQIDRWEQFEELAQRLVEQHGWRKDPTHGQRFQSASERMVDLIPCGGIVEENAIRFPPDGSHRMDARGFELALSESVLIRIDADLQFPVAPLPVLALLKIISWWDRDDVNFKQRDAQDLIGLLRHFAATDGAALLDQPGHADMYGLENDYEHRGAHLLGRVIAGMARAETLQLARLILNDGIDESGSQTLVIHGERAMPGDLETRADATYQLLLALQRGLETRA